MSVSLSQHVKSVGGREGIGGPSQNIDSQNIPPCRLQLSYAILHISDVRLQQVGTFVNTGDGSSGIDGIGIRVKSGDGSSGIRVGISGTRVGAGVG